MSSARSSSESSNPTDAVDLDFNAYLAEKRRKAAAHFVQGRPDYAFRGDYRLRATLGSVGPLRKIAEALTAASASVRRHHAMMEMARATPSQFAVLFDLVRECSRRLDLPTPSLFVESSPIVNAYTIATDDRAPFIVVSSGCLDAMNDDELRFVLGHECGHVHNLHGVYNLIGVLAGETAVAQSASWLSITGAMIGLARQAMSLGLAAWSRAGEITCDRAGAICVLDPESASSALAKLAAPVRTDRFGQADPLELARQARHAAHSIMRLEEAHHSHPLIGKRVLAVRAFFETDVLARHRPDLATAGERRTLAYADDLAERLLASATRI